MSDARKKQQLPDWAEAWVKGRCGCGARLVSVASYNGDHIACSRSAYNIDKCPEVKRSAVSS